MFISALLENERKLLILRGTHLPIYQLTFEGTMFVPVAKQYLKKEKKKKKNRSERIRTSDTLIPCPCYFFFHFLSSFTI